MMLSMRVDKAEMEVLVAEWKAWRAMFCEVEGAAKRSFKDSSLEQDIVDFESWLRVRLLDEVLGRLDAQDTLLRAEAVRRRKAGG